MWLFAVTRLSAASVCMILCSSAVCLSCLNPTFFSWGLVGAELQLAAGLCCWPLFWFLSSVWAWTELSCSCTVSVSSEQTKGAIHVTQRTVKVLTDGRFFLFFFFSLLLIKAETLITRLSVCAENCQNKYELFCRISNIYNIIKGWNFDLVHQFVCRDVHILCESSTDERLSPLSLFLQETWNHLKMNIWLQALQSITDQRTLSGFRSPVLQVYSVLLVTALNQFVIVDCFSEVSSVNVCSRQVGGLRATLSAVTAQYSIYSKYEH